MNRILSLITIILLSCIGYSADAREKNVVYATERIAKIADKLQLEGLADIPADTEERMSYFYNRKKLHIRKDKWGEVCHIGFSLFLTDVMASNRSVFEFIERYALEYALADPEERRHLESENITFWTGNIHTLQHMTGAESVVIKQRDMRDYRVQWQASGKELLTMAFPMEAQLILGCNAIELENLFMKNLMRSPAQKDSVQKVRKEQNTTNETFLIDAIRSELFYTGEKLVWNKRDWRKSLYNLIVSGQKMGDYTLKLTMDKYGYKTADEVLPIEQWVQYCQHEGCRMYLGIKEISKGVVKATAFAANHTLGYCHMLSLSIPQNELGGKSGTVNGRMYAYIPLHNLNSHVSEEEYSY